MSAARRPLVCAAALASLLACLPAACSEAPPAPSAPAPSALAPSALAGPRRPNVVLIVLDTTRGDRCSVNGHDAPTTPELEALGREGAVFRDCWSPSPWTAPSHATLFTGLLPRHHGLMEGRSYFLADERETLAEALHDRGYATACFTANDFIAPAFGLTQGFDFVERVYDQPESAYPVAPAAHQRAADWALAEHASGRPFFLFVNDIEPHAPYTPPPEIAARFVGDATEEEMAAARQIVFPAMVGISLGLTPVTARVFEVAARLYDAEIATVDAAVGDLARRLRDAGVLDDTVFIVLSDHGENLGDHGLVDHVFSVHRSVLHVPLVVRYPAAFAPGTIVDDVVRIEDVHATLVELCGLPAPRRADGTSLRGDTRGRAAVAEYGVPQLTLSVARTHYPDADLTRFTVRSRSIYDGRHHLIHRSDGRHELYDVTRDPGEVSNLIDSEPEIAAALRARLGP